MAISEQEKRMFLDLFLRDGRVLKMTNEEFDDFAKTSMGIHSAQFYTGTGPELLKELVNTASEAEVGKLLNDLLERYKVDYADEVASTSLTWGNADYKYLYERCERVVKRECVGYGRESERAGIKRYFKNEYVHQLIDDMYDSVETDPTKAIGEVKEILESCCKQILDNQGVPYQTNWDLPKLVKETETALGIKVERFEDRRGKDASQTIVMELTHILNSVSKVANKLGVLRNAYGTGHGKRGGYEALTSRYGRLAVGSSVTLVKFLFDTQMEKDRLSVSTE